MSIWNLAVDFDQVAMTIEIVFFVRLVSNEIF